ncbi:MAG: hypothetical protein P9L97_05660 [Candidatus Tenebribacter davisii]|nr:hypothetical protein [Candidatus Tenebribacter davisii]
MKLKRKLKWKRKIKRKIILHLCADLGSDSYVYKQAGYDVRCIGEAIGVENYNPPENVYGIIANPVCTEFSTANGFHKTGDLDKGMFLVDHCKRIIDKCSPKFWCIENPGNGRLKEKLGNPRYSYQPWWFGSPWTKKTSLWGDFNIPNRIYKAWDNCPKNDLLYVRPGRPKPSLAFLHKSAVFNILEFEQFIGSVDSDASFRSLCSQGFAKAFFQVNQ